LGGIDAEEYGGAGSFGPFFPVTAIEKAEIQNDEFFAM
jgi:hypothetical protein